MSRFKTVLCIAEEGVGVPRLLGRLIDVERRDFRNEVVEVRERRPCPGLIGVELGHSLEVGARRRKQRRLLLLLGVHLAQVASVLQVPAQLERVRIRG